MPEKIAILGGNRIPFARSNGPYAEASNQDMLTTALDGLVARFGLQGERAGEVVAGAVLKHSRDFNLTRECVLGSALDNATPAYDLQQACDTGLQAALAVGGKIAMGQIEWGIAGGVDTTSDAPLALNEDLRRLLMRARTSSATGRIKLLGHLRPGQIVPEIPRNAEPRTGMSMGEHQAITTERFGITREEQDELTVASHQGLAAAYERGFFDDLVTPYLGLERDQNLRPDSSTDKLAKLKPVFGDTMTAANSTPLSDGAAVALLSTDAWAKQRGLPVLAHLTASETAAVDYLHGEDGLLMAPVDAIRRLLDRTGLALGDFDLYEIHEAFAAQVLCTLKAVGEIDRSKLNVAGGSLAAGHPFAATGGRILATVAKLLAERGSGRALVSICAAGGQGVVAIVEREA
jgi:acetyl-CoA C-acetyltransferase